MPIFRGILTKNGHFSNSIEFKILRVSSGIATSSLFGREYDHFIRYSGLVGPFHHINSAFSNESPPICRQSEIWSKSAIYLKFLLFGGLPSLLTANHSETGGGAQFPKFTLKSLCRGMVSANQLKTMLLFTTVL